METPARTQIRQALDRFIVDIPRSPGQIVSGSPAMGGVTAKGFSVADLTKASVTTPLFRKYTGTEHLTLLLNWRDGGILTTCNAFVGLAGREMGARGINLGQFPIETTLKGSGKGHAWIPANSGKRPLYGDVFRPVSFHMGVSLDFVGPMWNTVESGQGGPASGFDIVKRKQGSWNPASLQGWVDIELFNDPRPAVPDWLPGWWAMYGEKKNYLYYFECYHNAFKLDMPSAAMAPAKVDFS